jgi:4-amino-4-deoxy-L-arabinose transferase
MLPSAAVNVVTNRWRVFLALFALYLTIFIVPLGARPVAMTDEARYAEIPREMLASGDWIVPHLDGLRYFEKPAMGYWLTALSIRAFGETPFGVRFSSAAAAGLTTLLLYWLVRRETEDLAAAACVCLVYLTSVLVVVVGTTNLLDTMFTAFATASIVFLVAGYRAGAPRGRMAFLTLAGLSSTMAFMTKGFIAFAVPASVIVPFVLWDGGARRLLWLAAWPAVVAGTTILPWAVAIHGREHDFWRYFFWEEHIRRFFSHEAQHSNPGWYFVPILLLGALPWTPVLPAALVGLTRQRRDRGVIRLATCWFLFPFLFFSASRGKLATYILPCFPGLAILISIGLLAYLRAGHRRTFQIGAAVVAVSATIAAPLVAAAELVPRMPALYAPDRGAAWIVAVVGFTACGGIAAIAIRATRPVAAVMALALAPTVLFAGIPFAIPDTVAPAHSADPFLRLHGASVPRESILVADIDRVAPVCWSFGRNDVSVLERSGELGYGLGYPDAAHRFLRVADLRRVIDENRGRRPVTMITTREHYDEYRRGLPDPAILETDPTTTNRHGLVIARY